MLSIKKIGIIRRGYRHLNRYRRILAVLIKYGFGELVNTLKIEQYFEIGLQILSRKPRNRVEQFSREERVRMALEELGPTFVKLGQILSTRPDLIPSGFIQEFSKLQDQVPPFAFDDVRQIIEKELGNNIEELFQEFEETPIAAASIGQVHKARLNDGEDVVVKVQRPDIRRIIEVDLEIMLHLAFLMERHVEELSFHKPTKIVNEFAMLIDKEIDYTVEASHMERFARQFQGDMEIYVPKVFRETSSERVITMEYIEGINASEIDRIDDEGLDRKIITQRSADLLLKQIFESGFFHADPHPGNIFILPENVICFLDYGMMGRIDRKTQEDFSELLYGLANRDESGIVQVIMRITEFEDEPNLRVLEREISDLIGEHLYKPLKDLKVGKLIQQLMELLFRNRLHLPPDLFLMMKALTTVEGVLLSLYPDFDLIERVKPFIKQIKRARMHPRRIADDIFQSGIELARLLQALPKETHDILMRLKKGKLGGEIEHRGLEPLRATLDQLSNRIALSIVIASLIVGSALIVLSKIPPLVFGIPVIGIIGFAAAAFMGFGLALAIFRKGML
ncbi:MAG: AarF/ABC1/UbiB kinase family protein [Thermodesulfobacteriota bacterium]|nr:AarF/ABC1/UbiB kinase family protein [Thermodesulfobacteriota bacterium]